MSSLTRTLMLRLLLASALVAVPLSSPFASASPDYGTDNPMETGVGSQELANIMNMNSLNIGIMNGFNPQQMMQASAGAMIGDAITNAMGIDGVLGDLVKIGITVGVSQGLQKISNGQMGVSMGNFGGFGNTALTSALLGGLQSGSTSGSGSLGAFALGAATAAAGAAMSGQDATQIAAAAAAGGIQGATAANTASLNP